MTAVRWPWPCCDRAFSFALAWVSQDGPASTELQYRGSVPARHLGTVYPHRTGPLPAFTVVKGIASSNIPFPIWEVR